MLNDSIMERDKKELSLAIDSFDKPKTSSGVAAWSQLMLNLLFLTPGTYPSLPLMGVDIESYQYEFIDTAIDDLTAIIDNQQRSYLPDVPLAGTKVTTMDYNGTTVLLIQLVFSTTTGNVSSVIAISTTPDKIIDVEVSW